MKERTVQVLQNRRPLLEYGRFVLPCMGPFFFKKQILRPSYTCKSPPMAFCFQWHGAPERRSEKEKK